MGSWRSDTGVWTPAKEKAVHRETGEIYEGPDRVASQFLKEEGVSSLGIDSKKDPENIMRARQLGMTIEEYLKLNEPATPEYIENQKKKDSQIVTHYQKKSKPGIKNSRGGWYDPEKGEYPKE